MVAILLLHAAGALLVGLLGRRLGRNVLLLGAVVPAVGLGYSAWLTPSVVAGSTYTARVSWAAELGLDITLRLDGFGLLFWWLITGIGVLVLLYAARYFGRRNDLGRFCALLVAFAGAMLLLVAADNLLVLFVAWELTSITSYLLIGFDDEDAQARGSALQALLVTGAGGLALLAGVVLVGQAAGTYELSEITASLPSGATAEVGLFLILLGAFAKSAQVPFHFWLPGAMAAPTPVSAYLHSATMVKAGIYVIARLAPPAAGAVSWWVPLVVTVGAGSLLLGGWRALRNTDLKSLLALGTVSQLGFMVMLLGAGDPELTHAGVALLVAHALFKATLFLNVGVVDHQAHTRDLRRLDGLRHKMPVTAVTAALAVASMAGVFPLLGFIAKETALTASLQADLGRGFATAAVVVGAILTTAYGIRLLWGAFASKRDPDLSRNAIPIDEVDRPALSFEAPALVLVAATVVFGLWITPLDAFVEVAAGSLDREAAGLHLALWHGIGAPLGLSLLALAAGGLLFWAKGFVRRVARWTDRFPDASAAYRRSLFGLNRVADLVSAAVQPGSLPFYGAVVLVTVLLLPGSVLVSGFTLPEDLAIAASAIQAAAALGVVMAALMAARVRQRLSAVLLLGGVGFGVAVLFIVQGAPDLALTQLLVETLALAMFVVVLQRLPKDFTHVPWRLGQGLRVVIAVGVGLFTAAFALWTAATEQVVDVSDDLLARAFPEAGGSNVVNVILTDFRAIDTVGEITVLVVAAIGIRSLVRAGRRDEDVTERSDEGNRA